jgi:hypothetical protein
MVVRGVEVGNGSVARRGNRTPARDHRANIAAVTLVLSVHSRDSLWLVVDRRLSYGRGRRPIDDAVKVMTLETTDGVGLLAYAGLGATPRRTQPSEWMSAVLRGRMGLTFEQALGVLSTAATKELPRYLASMPGGAHSIVVPAFVRGIGRRVYSIDNVVDAKTRQHWYRYTSHQCTALPTSPSPRIVMAGTGGLYLARNGEGWQRALRHLVNAHDRGKVSDHSIADQLARLNYEAHRKVGGGTVGPKCIVMWRRRPDARRRASGSAHQFYTGIDREPDSGAIPTISNGMDIQSIVGVLLPQVVKQIADWRAGAGPVSNLDVADLNRQLAKLPSAPDERLR